MHKQNIIAATLCFCGLLFVANVSYGQVDPGWLKSYNAGLENRPPTLSSSARIADENEVGIPLVIHGTLVNPDGTPASDVIVHGYHRDHDGFELGPGDRSLPTWELQGWAQSDEKGNFEFRTIRPAADHLGREAAHIHFTLESGVYGRQWAPKVILSDDALVTEAQRKQSKRAGEYGFVKRPRLDDGVLHIDVKIKLKVKADF